MPIKFLALGGVVGFFRRGGWKCQFYFYGRGDFSDKCVTNSKIISLSVMPFGRTVIQNLPESFYVTLLMWGGLWW